MTPEVDPTKSPDAASTSDTTTDGAASPRICVTEKAAEYMKTKLMFKGQPGAALRIGVKGGGCNGLTYVTEIDEKPPRKRDLVYEFHGLKVLVDTRSVKYIDGAVVDYENTLMYQGLRFKNPLEESSCGCGETFSVADSVMKAATAK